MRHVAWILALVVCWTSAAAAGPHAFRGQRLDDALRLLQRTGLPIIFSSEIVTADMRVTSEPRATNTRDILNELLAAHGLKAEAGPGGTLLVVRDPRAVRRSPAHISPPRTDEPVTPSRAPTDGATFTDRVIVHAADGQVEPAASGMALDGRTLRAMSNPAQSDGLDAVRAMPGVAADDDFRADFSVRGSPYRQIGIVVDGVATRWLQHTVYGRKDASSLSMFGSGILDRGTLQSGAFPRLYDETLGAQLDLSIKEGSRDTTHFAGLAGGTSAAFLADGPLGSNRRGSWTAGVRNSYRSWPPETRSPQDSAFAFADMHAKLVYDVTATQQVTVTALGGRSTLDTMDDPFDGAFGAGTDRAALVTAGWQSTLPARTVLRQRLFYVGQQLASTPAPHEVGSRLVNRAIGYRADAMRGVLGGVLDAGAELSALSAVRDRALVGRTALLDAFTATWATHAAFVDFARMLPGRASFEAGARASDSTLVRDRAVSPWILTSVRLARGWTVKASAGSSHQFPDVDAVMGAAGSPSLVPEAATHVDVGIARQWARLMWQTTAFTRVERHILRAPADGWRLADGVLVQPPITPFHNALTGSSRGVEIIVTPRETTRLAGWMSYTFAATRQTDATTGETFAADFDRRHAFNADGFVTLPRQMVVGLVVRAASGLPIPGYFTATNGTLLVGDRRNTVRLPPYIRLDARMQRTFFASRHAVTLFGELLNVFDADNRGIGDGVVDPIIGIASGFMRSLSPRRATFGIQLDLSR